MTNRTDTYRITGTLATGGTAVLYRAVQTSLDRTVVVKRLHAHLVADPTFMRRFELEAKSAASLDHENIVRIIDFGRDDDGYFIVMEYIDGPSLRDLLAERRVLDEDTALVVAREICRGLAHAHGRGIVHRDVKPANIMISRDGAVKITDFGLVKLSQSAAQATVADSLLGTPLYMSPEQAIGETVDGRSDLFSLGTICYEALTGEQPFRGDTYAAVLRKIMDGAVAPPSRRRGGLRPATEAIVLKALAREPSRRYRGAAEMARAIEDVLGRDAVLGSRERLRRLANAIEEPSSPSPPRRAGRRRTGGRLLPVAAALAGAAAIAVLSFVGALRGGFSGGIDAIRRSDPVQASAGMIPALPENVLADVPPASADAAPADSSAAPAGIEAPRDTTLSIAAPIPRPAATEARLFEAPVVDAPREPAPARAPAAAPAAPPTGFLDVAVDPPADVIVDGVRRTTSGRVAMLELEAGPHRLLCRRDGYRDYEERLVIVKGEASRRRIELAEIMGRLVVDGIAGARVYVDGTLRGALPTAEPIALSPGRHTVEIRKPGFVEWRNVVIVPAEEPLRLSVTLVPSSEAR